MDVFLFLMTLSLATLRMATPLVLTSMGGLLSERSGVVNVALEGYMLTGAFVAAVTTHFSGSPWTGVLAAMMSGLVVSALYAFFVIELKANQVVTGTAINLLVIGVVPFTNKLIFNSTGSTPALDLAARFTFAPIVFALIAVGAISWWLYQTHSGLWLLFAGEHPQALITSGISLRKVRWFAAFGAGVLAAVGGSCLSLWLASSYSPLMTGGRGFMALAALIFGKWRPLPTLAACLFFGLVDALQIRMQGVHIVGIEIPVQFIQILPYLLTIIALAGLFGKSEAPKALGREA